MVDVCCNGKGWVWCGGLTFCSGLVIGLTILFCSFNSLEYEEIGLQWSATRQQVSEKTFEHGIHLLGVGDHFLKFPSKQQNIYFLDKSMPGRHDNPLQSRTNEGLPVSIPVSFFFRIVPAKLFSIYQTYGMDYEQIIIRRSIDVLTSVATRFNASSYFSERSVIEIDMKKEMKKCFQDSGFDILDLHLRTMDLPDAYDRAVQETQEKKQDIAVAKQEHNSKLVQFETLLDVAKKSRHITRNVADAAANSRVKQTNATLTRDLAVAKQQVDGYKEHRERNELSVDDLLHYIKIQMLEGHDSKKLTVNVDGF